MVLPSIWLAQLEVYAVSRCVAYNAHYTYVFLYVKLFLAGRGYHRKLPTPSAAIMTFSCLSAVKQPITYLLGSMPIGFDADLPFPEPSA